MWLVDKIKDFRRVLAPAQWAQIMFGDPHGVRPDVSADSLLKRYTAWAYICASRNGSAVASVPLRLYATRGTGQQKSRRPARTLSRSEKYALASRAKEFSGAIGQAADVEEVIEHPVLDLLKTVNSQFNGYETHELTSIFQDCTGNAYWYVEMGPLGIPSAIYMLQPQHIRIIPSAATMVKEYAYGVPGIKEERFDPREVIHFRHPNPHSPFYGMGCIEASAMAIDRYHDMDVYEQSMNRRMGIPPLLIRYKTGKIDDAQRKKLEREWNNTMGGVTNAGKVKVADYDWEVQQLGVQPRDMGFAEGRKWTRLEIADAFGVPLALLDTENVNRSNSDTAMYQYQKFTILPRLIRTQQKLNERLIPMYDEPRLFLAYDNPVPSDERQLVTKNVEYVKANILTINEVRSAQGLQPVEWGDEPMTQQSAAVKPDPEDDDQRATPDSQKAAWQYRTKLKKKPLTKNEREIASALDGVWERQRDAALRNVTIGGITFDWVASQSWAEEIVEMTRASIGADVNQGAIDGAMQIGQTLPSAWIEQPSVQSFIDKHSYRFALQVNEGTRDILRDEMKEGMAAGETIDQLSKRIEEVFAGTEREARAEMIARTESARAQTGGKLIQWKESGVVEAKIWDASGDACQFCLALNGTTVSLDRAFADLGGTLEGLDGGLMKVDYEDIEGPPAHPNCTCVLQAKLIPQYEEALGEA